MATAGRETEPSIALTPDELDPIDEFRKQHSTAVLVILFTDLKGSTELAEQLGEVPAQNHRLAHNRILREIIERQNAGRVIKTIGDSFMCVFAEPAAAVERAVEIQQRLAQHNAEHPDDHPIQVRIGMHMGQVVVEDAVQADVFGRHVNRAARVESIAQGGQILLTLPVYDSARGWLEKRGYVWSDHGDYALKGIGDPTRIYEVASRGSIPRRPRGKRPGARRTFIVATLILIAVLVPLGVYFKVWQRYREWRWLVVEPAREISDPTQIINPPSGDPKTNTATTKPSPK